MKSHTTAPFRRLYAALPPDIRAEARRAYRRWRDDPQHESLQFKEISLRRNKSVWSVRVSLGWRVVGFRPAEDEIVWIWIGSHADYDRLIQTKRKERGGGAGSPSGV